MATAMARLDSVVTYEVRNGVVDRVDVGRLDGDTVAAPLSGSVRRPRYGTAPAEAVACFRSSSTRCGTANVESTMSLRRRGSIAGAHSSTPAARCRAAAGHRADARPFDSTRTFVVRRASLERVDVGTLMGRLDSAGPVTLRLRGSGCLRGTARDFEGGSMSNRRNSAASRCKAAAPRIVFYGDRATYDASLGTSGGALALAGDASGLGRLHQRRRPRGPLRLARRLDAPRPAGARRASRRRFTASGARPWSSTVCKPMSPSISTVPRRQRYPPVRRLTPDGRSRRHPCEPGSPSRAPAAAGPDGARRRDRQRRPSGLGGSVAASGAMHGVRVDTRLGSPCGEPPA